MQTFDLGAKGLRELNSSPLPGSVQATCVRTPLDFRVFPPASALLSGAATTVVRSPTHPGLLRSRRVFRIVQSALEADG